MGGGGQNLIPSLVAVPARHQQHSPALAAHHSGKKTQRKLRVPNASVTGVFFAPDAKIKKSEVQAINNADLFVFLMPVFTWYNTGKSDFPIVRFGMSCIFRLSEVSECSKHRSGQSTKPSGTQQNIKFSGRIFQRDIKTLTPGRLGVKQFFFQSQGRLQENKLFSADVYDS